MRQKYGGPKLPKELRDQVGDPANQEKSERRFSTPINRKDRRKAGRVAKRADNSQQARRTAQQAQTRRNEHRDNQLQGARRRKADEEKDSDKDKSITSKSVVGARDSKKTPKSILKKTTGSTEPVQASVSRTTKDKIAEADAEIAALEKRLGIKGNKKAKGAEGGLDDLFRDLGDFDGDEEAVLESTVKRKRPADEDWLASKRRKALGEVTEPSSDEEDDYDELDDLDSIEGSELDDINNESDVFEGFESEEESSVPIKPRVRENPYVAPVTANAPDSSKYVPPALRVAPSSDAEALARLRRQIQGLLNRLSDAKVLTILRDIEQIYQNNPRAYVTTTLIDLLMGLLADPTILLDTFLILHAGFIAAVYKVIGPDFGAQIVERIVSEFDKQYENNKDGNGKHTTNLISVVADLYTFQLVGSNLVFDYIKLFLGELSQINTELLLRVVRLSGPQLRQDDPSSMKDIVMLLQKSVADVGKDTLPVRTKFMIETITDLKNNRMKTGVAASAVLSEHTTMMKKQLGTLNSRNLKGTEPLRIGLADIRETEKKGKWWLVGASWRNETTNDAPGHIQETVKLSEHNDPGGDDVDLSQLAREEGMNTDVRRVIFITIMSAVDFKDAHMRLLKLNLKRSQEVEIPHILVHCAGRERDYNPYYTLVARKVCSNRKARKPFQFALWNLFKTLGEKTDGIGEEVDDDESDDDMLLRKLVNIAKMYGNLIAKADLSITYLKVLNFPYLQPNTKSLVEVMLVTVIIESQRGVKEGRDEKALLNIFINVDAAPGMIADLQYFMKKVVSKTELTASTAEKETVRWGCRIVADMLNRLLATITLDEEN
ncbi:hypothetical protein BDV95DRAFT_480556 [Massariosphaeria phaeospora]|uniref:MI domain-containing protein n=1 Tax=Massariosphaeria phaeospora TaxID=100035 RepID=A0A7C8IJK7_9PLEO|nr:hypothetical protein BDV95DRAFT_480556 [Massariosphaeria phaeospora]